MMKYIRSISREHNDLLRNSNAIYRPAKDDRSLIFFMAAIVCLTILTALAAFNAGQRLHEQAIKESLTVQIKGEK